MKKMLLLLIFSIIFIIPNSFSFDKNWEAIGKNTERLKVFGGWLVATYCYDTAVSMVFIQDPNYQWIIEEDNCLIIK